MKIGYARVSSTDQNLDRQRDALEKVGVERLYFEKVSGARTDRPELTRVLEVLRQGDTLVVSELSRLGRNTAHLLELAETFKAQGIQLVSLKEGLDSTTAAGQLIFTVFAALAQFERDLSRERAAEGRSAARARGRSGGRPEALSTAQKKQLLTLSKDPSLAVREICHTLGISRATYYRHRSATMPLAAPTSEGVSTQ